MIWDGFSGQKEVVIQSTSAWVLSACFSPSTTLVACGGLDNRCAIFKVDERMSGEGHVGRITMPKKTIAQHDKYISHCVFFGSDQQV